MVSLLSTHNHTAAQACAYSHTKYGLTPIPSFAGVCTQADTHTQTHTGLKLLSLSRSVVNRWVLTEKQGRVALLIKAPGEPTPNIMTFPHHN